MDVVPGYLLSVGAASLYIFARLVRDLDGPPDVSLLGILLVFIVFLTAILAALPFYGVVLLASALRTNALLFYLGCGALTGLLMDSIVAAVGSSNLMGQIGAQPFQHQFVRYLPDFLAGGLVGSGCYWLVAGRFVKFGPPR